MKEWEGSEFMALSRYTAYNALLYGLSPVLIPAAVGHMVRMARMREGLAQRLGHYPKPLRVKMGSKSGRGWIHAVSVGEAMSARSLVVGLREQRPDLSFMVSTVTATGQSVAQGLLKEGDFSFYLPLDFPGMVRRIVAICRPSFLAIIETELWPNLIRICALQGIPVVILNGRISDRSFPRYRMFRGFMAEVLSHVAALGMQSETDAERISALGAIPSRIQVTGNIKFDSCASAVPSQDAVRGLAEAMALQPEARIWVAGSTHPGEEEVLMAIHRRLLDSHPDLVFVIAPRHLDRAEEVASVGRKLGLRVALRSKKDCAGAQVVVLDTLGELFALYGLATVVFMGKSLFPDRSGGQNPIEPALWGKPVLMGPYVQNFREVSEKMVCGGGAFIAHEGGTDLEGKVRALLDDPHLLAGMGEKAKGIVASNLGAARRSVALLSDVLSRRPVASG